MPGLSQSLQIMAALEGLDCDLIAAKTLVVWVEMGGR